jgi:hypothetical protein
MDGDERRGQVKMKRIRYVSRFAASMSSGQIDEIVSESEQNNERDGITGMLVATGSLFFQLIEGPDEAVEDCYARILRDSRHEDVQLVGLESGDLERVCPDWAMGKVDLSAESNVRLEPVKAILEAVCHQRRVIEDLVGVLERTMWRELIDAETHRLTELA